MVELPADFVARMRTRLGSEFQAFLKSYERQPEKAVRINTLKIPVDSFREISPFVLEPVAWEPSGFYVSGDGLGKTVAHAAGLYYVQEPSAMSAVPELGICGGERVLDLCSAPGGKGTQIAQYLNGTGVVVMNEINRKRFDVMRGNIERLGVKNCIAVNLSPEELARYFCNYFDKILVDAPCSGEGMFKKEPEAIPEWSVGNVEMCASRQSKILESADKMLAEGGTLVYSTCTFSDEEDGNQIEKFLGLHGNYVLESMHTLYPHVIRGEGHFVAVLKKGGKRKEAVVNVFKEDKKTKKANAEALSVYRQWESETLKLKLGNLVVRSGSVYMLTETVYEELSYLVGEPSFDTGVYLGRISDDGKRFIPSHRAAMCLKAENAECIDLNEADALKYLKGMTFDCDAPLNGWRLVTFKNYPLGWCKVSRGIAKNHLPKGVRI